MAGLTAAQITALDSMCPSAADVALGTILDSILTGSFTLPDAGSYYTGTTLLAMLQEAGAS